ncbi:hypothetical protein CDL15_Pgr023301 [Punica granatum]|uniref:Uncharacterized protein n=1 Tax=Punica granatum TaxID=22663 RepID=A0A218Y1M3_PUNGR|nr:hypothetical protein CDL15_Pgr023301 [Punica granatum]
MSCSQGWVKDMKAARERTTDEAWIPHGITHSGDGDSSKEEIRASSTGRGSRMRDKISFESPRSILGSLRFL